MKICLLKYKSRSSDSINDVMENSLIDLGHKLVDHEKAEIVIAIRDFSKIGKRYPDKKYILFQIEQYIGKQEQVEEFYAYGPAEIWGFDIKNKKEKYTPLGYHPCLEFESQLPEDINVGFIGWMRGRRSKQLSNVRNKWEDLNTFDTKVRGENISRTKINLNIHFYEDSMFTEWGRIAYFLANKQFFISEHFYCPITIPQFRTIQEYDSMVDCFLKYEDERKELSAMANKVYKRDFDMRNILKERL